MQSQTSETSFWAKVATNLGLVGKFDLEKGAIALIYIVQGALGISHLALSFFLKDELGLSPAQSAAMIGFAMLPWTIKPLYGFISDCLPIAGYRRRPYLVFFNLLGALSWVFMAQAVHTPTMALGTILVGTLSMAFSDVIIDALVVQRARAESEGDAGSLQAFTWGCMSVGAIASAYFSGSLVEEFGTRPVFMIAAILPILDAVAAFAISDAKISFAQINDELLKVTAAQELDQPPSSAPEASLEPDHSDRPAVNTFQLAWQNVRQQMKQLWQAVSGKSILLPTLFIFLWQATPSADSAFFYFVTNDLSFNPEFLGRVRLVTSVASLVGVWIFQRYLRDVPMRRIFLWTTIISTLLGLTSLLLVTHANRMIGIDDRWFSLGDSLILTVAGRIAFMPLLVLAARLCPVGIEATLFALLMSVLNLAGLCSYQLGAGLTYLLGITETNFENLWILVTITNLTTLLPLPFLHWLPADGGNMASLNNPEQPEPNLGSTPELLSSSNNGATKLDIASPEPVAIASNNQSDQHPDAAALVAPEVDAGSSI